jgi:vacuolar-type H+-ATPase subunit E/Vma4
MSEQEQKLRDEILNDAKRKAERALSRAQKDAKKAHDQAATDQKTERDQALGRAQERASARSQAILATVSQEVHRRRLLAREEVIEACIDDALAATVELSADGALKSLGGLLTEALAALGPGEATVRVRPDDVSALGPDFLAKLGINPSTLAIEADETIVGGLIVQSADGRRQFDNTYATRRERLHEQLRTLLASEIEF